jgi:cation transport regulator
MPRALSIEHRSPCCGDISPARSAQDIYREAFNHAYDAHAGDVRQEEAAHRIAWAAVKRSYIKIGDDWISKPGARNRSAG